MRLVMVVSLISLVVWTAPAALAQETIRWGGEWQSAVKFSWLYGERSDDASTTLRLQARMGSFPWRVVFDGRGGIEGAVLDPGAWKTRGAVDRLYLRLYYPSADVIIGKQAVNWGVGYAFSPTEVFNPPDPLDPDGTRTGVTAAVMQVPVGPLDLWSLAVSEEKYGVRRRGNVAGTDWAVLGVAERDSYVVGTDAKGDLGVGWHAAAAYRWPKSGASGVVHGLVGADYSWLWGDLTWIGEYAFQMDLGAADSYRHVTFQQVGYRVDDFTAISGSVLADLTDGGRIWTAGANTFLGAQTQLALSASTTPGMVGSPLAPLPWSSVQAQLKYVF